ncbi:MAG: MATE family efflux transporter [Cyanobacteria bacterium P01_H01_bin.35]
MTSQKQSQITDEILQGNLIELMFKLSIPSILGVLVFSLNSFIDALFAGRFMNETALAGISLAGSFTSIVGGFAGCIGIGSASVLSRAIGAGDVKTQSKVFSNVIIMSIVISFFITIIGYGFSQELITFMGGRGEVALEGTKYFKTYIIGTIIFITGGACSSIIIAEGQTRITTISTYVFVTVNVLLNYIFISVYSWGTPGLALATIIAMVVSSIINFGYFIFGKSFISINLKKITLAIDILPPILSAGISSLFFPVITLIQNFVVFNSISDYGTKHDIAFFAATVTVNSLAFIPVAGLAQALGPIIGMNYGAKKQKRIKKAYLIFVTCGFLLLLLIWLPLQLSPRTFLGIILSDVNFTDNDIFNFRILSLITPIFAFGIFSFTFFRSIGKDKIILVCILLRTIVLKIPMMLFFSKIYEVKGIYYGLFLADIIMILIVFVFTFLEFKNLTKLKFEQ